MSRYLIQLRKYKEGKNGATRYRFSTRLKAICFAAGFQAALHEIGRNDLHVSVKDCSYSWHNEHYCEIIADSDFLAEMAVKDT